MSREDGLVYWKFPRGVFTRSIGYRHLEQMWTQVEDEALKEGDRVEEYVIVNGHKKFDRTWMFDGNNFVAENF